MYLHTTSSSPFPANSWWGNNRLRQNVIRGDPLNNAQNALQLLAKEPIRHPTFHLVRPSALSPGAKAKLSSVIKHGCLVLVAIAIVCSRHDDGNCIGDITRHASRYGCRGSQTPKKGDDPNPRAGRRQPLFWSTTSSHPPLPECCSSEDENRA
jgi:hypothetical protein